MPFGQALLVGLPVCTATTPRPTEAHISSRSAKNLLPILEFADDHKQ